VSLAIGISTMIAVAGAILAVSLSNILHAVFGLAISLLGCAGLFFALGSPFVAAMEVLVYVGGISVAMVFAVMLSHSIASRPEAESVARRLSGAIPASLFFITMAYAIHKTTFVGAPAASAEAWSVEAIGRDLLTHYSLVFELLSLVLLVAIMGAIAIATRETEETE
jgi:NADH-quinone oxidoreductase subunit J